MDSEPPTPPAAAPAPEVDPKEMVYRIKVVQFLGRTTPIILQNDNGPCPLLAICNVLSLKNNLNLSPDISEVSQEKLLGLVAERLIDSNTNDKDDGYAENQQQNIADAIDLLPRLTTGIDVNIKFRRIDDFEFTRECAIFDLLDIPLYHGWIVDPQDSETAGAIDAKSYNTLVGELVALETQTMEIDAKNNIEADTVDFAAATTAALGVPSPCLSRGQSFNESPHKERKGDIEEEAELLKALKLSEEDKSISITDSILIDDAKLKESACVKNYEPVTLSETVKSEVTNEKTLLFDDTNACVNNSEPVTLSVTVKSEVANENTLLFDDTNALVNHHADQESIVEKSASDAKIEDKKDQNPSFEQEPVSSSSSILDEQKSYKLTQNESNPTTELVEPRNVQNGCEERDSSGLLASTTDSDSSSGRIHKNDEPDSYTAIVDSSEPIYEGEECILESAISAGYENKEPVYEGEVVLAEQVDRDCKIDGYVNTKDGMSIKEGELIRNFIKNSASQLTIYGLFCLQDKVKERELCVFFRNNHFNTMFKYEGELYILATDQGYLNQPDLVWEKLNEVNGDTVFMTGNFKEFKVDDQTNSSWDEQNAMTNTADYLANIDGQEHSSFNSDLQLAIALQQQEFEQQQQQPQQQQQRNSEEPAVSGSSRLVTGPQVHGPRPTPPLSKQESKSKEKCIIM